MNILVILNGDDVTDSCRLQETRINYDSTRRITTASLTIMGRAFNRTARYDYAHYDQNRYALNLRELYEVMILDGRDGVTKLFDGQIYSLEMQQSDAVGFEIFYKCELNDWAAWLDRSVCWDSTFPLPLPASDRDILTALLARFCPRIVPAAISTLVPVIQKFDWLSKTMRQVLDDLTGLSMGEWRVDFNGALFYMPASAAPDAPFALSTSPDNVTSFEVQVNGYRHDFSNPVNQAYVRGAVDPASGAFIQASYADPLSIAQYGEYSSALVDNQITTAWDASLRAKSMVLQNANPIEQGNFTIWKDGLACGMKVHITEENLGIDGWYTIRALSLQWENQYVVRYEAQFGSAQPDLETILRLLTARAKWGSTTQSVGTPAPGSVTNASIAPPGLSASVIQSVNANTLIGLIQAGQIQSVNAGAIVGAINAGQIGSVSSTAIQGAIVAGQIGSVSATTIQGVIISDQLANGIIDDLAKYAAALAPVRIIKATDPWPPAVLPTDMLPPNTYFYYEPNGHFYRVNPDGMGWTDAGTNSAALTGTMSFYHIGAISAGSITGLILAAQIGSITAGQITGQIQASQIQSVNASSISGQITASQIASVSASVIQGTISAAQIGSVNASSITGTVVSTQIGSVNAATITIGLVGDNQIGSVSGAKLITGDIECGGKSGKPGSIRVYDGSTTMIGQIGYLDSAGIYGGWFKVFGAGGTGYNDAKVKTDQSGNLSISNANFSVTANADGSVLSTSPTTFDSTYSSIALQIDKSGDSRSKLVSRGLIIYDSFQRVVGSLVKNASNQGAELDLYNIGGTAINVLIDGPSGQVAALGFAIRGGAVGTSGTCTVNVGTRIFVSGGLVTGWA